MYVLFSTPHVLSYLIIQAYGVTAHHIDPSDDLSPFTNKTTGGTDILKKRKELTRSKVGPRSNFPCRLSLLYTILDTTIRCVEFHATCNLHYQLFDSSSRHQGRQDVTCSR